MYVCMYVCIVCMCMHVCIYVCTYVYECVCMHVCVCLYACVNGYVYVCICACIFIYVSKCVCVYAYEVQVSTETQRGCWIPWSWSHLMESLGMKLRSSEEQPVLLTVEPFFSFSFHKREHERFDSNSCERGLR